MAGIDRTDAIKRPTDSTLAPRTLDRGSEPVVRVRADSLDALRPSLPALAVVVEQTIMGSRDKPVYDLVLSLNQQWVRVQSERAFPPGTVLMVEATPENQLRVLPQVDTAQLNRMMRASLQFWQAHSLPRAHTTQMPAPPAFPALQRLAGDAPELQSLVQWLSQKPTLSARTVAQWMQVFSPLAQLQPPVASLPATPLIPSPAQPAVANPSTPTTASVSTPVNALYTAPLTPLLNAIASVHSASTPLPGFPHSVGPTASGNGAPVMLIPLAPGAPALPSGTAMVITIATDRAQSNLPTQSALPAPQRTPVDGNLAAPTLLRIAVVVNPQTSAAAQSAQTSLPTSFPGAAVQPTAGSTGSATPLLTQNVPPGQPGNPNPTTTPPDPLLAPTRFSTLAPPPDTSSQAGRDPVQVQAVPVEIRLSQWLAVLDSRIQQHPASLQQALAQQAQRLLNAPPTGYAPGVTVKNQSGGSAIKQDDLQPLLQLRTLLESLQGKTQNNAIQQALGALANPEAPPVQQLSIPMLWLGPNHWLNMEWWHEKPEGEEAESDSPGSRPFRFRLFFELAPLAPLCADLHWTPDHTDVTFWSQDQGTLSIINNNLDTLEQWTQGLGERDLHTRHGMPPKKTTPEPDQFKPLVDVRT
ncbi:hypothetical protein [Saccharospirillum alexandrii]|uniref:hypothetical protein n=1 Tax=Saccharospirillum alexandrii TaxID=2448477 RepID=UPI000FDCBBFB|nr:hypothetical protein [Saccharospirillum alexandrii]